MTARFSTNGEQIDGLSIAEASIEQELERLRNELRARDDFIAVLAHELRNPVGAIHLQAEALLLYSRRGENAVPAQVVARLESLKRQTDAFVRRATTLLDVSRAAAGQVPLSLETADLSAIVRSVIEGYRAELELRRIAVSVSLPSELVGSWDRVRIEQVTSNLLTNAIKYGDGKPIRIVLKATQGHAVLAVRDRGIGIRPADQERIFERFARGVKRSDDGGFGVGLWLVRMIVHAMGGTITVRSREGEGSRFLVCLPRAPLKTAEIVGEVLST